MYYLVVFLIVFNVYFVKSSGVTVGIQSYSQPIEHQYYSQDGLGSYVYGYITPFSTKTEFRTHEGVTKGGYSYIDPKGEVQTVEYTADAENGFRVATTNLPKDDPDVAYAKHKHFEEFERIKAEHAALAAEHSALAAKLNHLTERDWSQGSIEKLLGSVHGSHNQWHDNSALEKARNLHEQAYRAALEAHRQAALFNGHNPRVEEQNRHDNQEGQEKWEDTWEAQKLRDQQQQQQQQQNTESNWENHSGWNHHNIDQHRAVIEATISAERELIARANEERNRQIQALQQAQQLYQASLSRLQETRTHQHSIYQSSIEAHQEAAKRLEEARLRQEEADRNWNAIHNNQNHQWNTGNQDDQHRANYEAVIRAEKEHIARAQEERNRQLQAYHEAIQRYRESETRLEHTRNEQTAAYQSALDAHRDATQRLQEVALQQGKTESYWNSIHNSQDHRGAYKAAIAQANELHDRHLQTFQQAQQAYQESAKRLEETKHHHSDAYNAALESHQQATKQLQETQQQKEEAERNLYTHSWNNQNENNHNQVRIVAEARKRALAEADRAFNEFTSAHISSNNFIRNDIPLKVKVYAPVQLVESNKGVKSEALDLYSYGSLKIPEIRANGGYSFIDKNGVLQTMQYVSNHLKGFRISDVNSALESITSDSDKTIVPAEKVQAVDRQVEEITPQIHQEVEEGSVQEGADWEGDGASYSTEIKYK